MRVVVLTMAFMFHYHFIVNRLKTQNDEAIKVLEDLPEGTEGH